MKVCLTFRIACVCVHCALHTKHIRSHVFSIYAFVWPHIYLTLFQNYSTDKRLFNIHENVENVRRCVQKAQKHTAPNTQRRRPSILYIFFFFFLLFFDSSSFVHICLSHTIFIFIHIEHKKKNREKKLSFTISIRLLTSSHYVMCILMYSFVFCCSYFSFC